MTTIPQALRTTLALAFVAATAACASTSSPTTSAAVETERLHASIRGVRMTSQGEQAFAIRDELKSGESIAFYVTANAESYVAIVQFDSRGAPTVLFPKHGEQKVPANQPTRVPPSSQSFRLDDATGTENVYLIATRRPLGETDRELADLVGDVRSSPDAVQTEALQPDVAPLPTTPSPKPTQGSSVEPGTVLVDAGASGSAKHALVPEAPAAKPEPAAAKPVPTKAAFAAPARPARLASLRTRSIGLLDAPCPPDVKCRGLKLVGAMSYDGDEDEKGVVVIHFPFNHVK